jgi:hypothetical protein
VRERANTTRPLSPSHPHPDPHPHPTPTAPHPPAEYDVLTSSQDVAEIQRRLAPEVQVAQFVYDGYGHMDFVVSGLKSRWGLISSKGPQGLRVRGCRVGLEGCVGAPATNILWCV